MKWSKACHLFVQMCPCQVAATCWIIWLSRNDIIFKHKSTSVSKLISDVKAVSFTWIKNRAGLAEIGWDNWKAFNL
ncbi:hypothetical protein HanXRQr2_Chr12g0559741 [Helianthus annuus]|uniref:Reverse transcriptase zinc-binding domain-containing protein n=2 Tax=Helianthus annuus TaxID=4232 RepID=A0A9K3HJH0_HELAN|nr:hypothetical protein HanXRQr2_Chr12g0559741 [Helianthus annuus]